MITEFSYYEVTMLSCSTIINCSELVLYCMRRYVEFKPFYHLRIHVNSRKKSMKVF